MTGSKYLSHGISKEFHGDIEYLYAVYPDRLEIYSTSFWEKKSKKLLLSLSYTELPEKEILKTEIPQAKGKLPKTFYIFIAIIIVFTLGNSSDAFLILRAKNLGLTLLEIPLVIALFNLVYALIISCFSLFFIL